VAFITRRKNGSIAVVARIGGRRRWKTARTMADAKLLRAEMTQREARTARDGGGSGFPASTTVEEYSKAWLKACALRLKPRSLAGYTDSVERVILRLEAPLIRIVADDWLVSIDTNRYSVPFTLIGQPVEAQRRNGHLRVFHRGVLVAEHPELDGKHQVRILPEHGPGASARTVRLRHSTLTGSHGPAATALVEVRDLAVYDALVGDTEIATPLVRIDPGPNAALAVSAGEVPA